jgi:hypothetical protein
MFEKAKQLNEEMEGSNGKAMVQYTHTFSIAFVGQPRQSIYIVAADFLIHCNAGQLAERALAHVSISIYCHVN